MEGGSDYNFVYINIIYHCITALHGGHFSRMLDKPLATGNLLVGCFVDAFDVYLAKGILMESGLFSSSLQTGRVVVGGGGVGGSGSSRIRKQQVAAHFTVD